MSIADDVQLETPFPVRSVEKIEMIKTTTLWGTGSEENPRRVVIQYWTMDGKCIVMLDSGRVAIVPK